MDSQDLKSEARKRFGERAVNDILKQASMQSSDVRSLVNVERVSSIRVPVRMPLRIRLRRSALARKGSHRFQARKSLLLRQPRVSTLTQNSA
jgi:hypothetical protein